jgi:hypothetical protein
LTSPKSNAVGGNNPRLLPIPKAARLAAIDNIDNAPETFGSQASFTSAMLRIVVDQANG